MKRVAFLACFAFLLSVVDQSSASLAQTNSSTANSTLLPAGTKFELVVTAPVWARTAKPGDALYAQVDFPVIVGKSIAIPAGTFVQGSILSIARPSRFKSKAEIQVLFTTLIFTNGYAVPLPALPSIAAPADSDNPSSAASMPSPAIMKLTIAATSSNDLLLDNGTQFNLQLASPLSLDTDQIAAANAANRPFDLDRLKSASLCRPTPGTPGTPGTPDTVIPGSPGTPSTTVPGGPGQPDIVIPGTPATPDTVIPGSPGTPGFPGTTCPSAPMVISSELLPTPPASNTALAAPKHP